MARDKVRVWYDREGDYLEVMFDLETPGYFRDTQDDRVMEKVELGPRARALPRSYSPGPACVASMG